MKTSCDMTRREKRFRKRILGKATDEDRMRIKRDRCQLCLSETLRWTRKAIPSSGGRGSSRMPSAVSSTARPRSISMVSSPRVVGRRMGPDWSIAPPRTPAVPPGVLAPHLRSPGLTRSKSERTTPFRQKTLDHRAEGMSSINLARQVPRA